MFDLAQVLPPPDRFAVFLVAALALNLTPGADMTYVLTRSVAQGRAAGVASAFGITVGALGHTILAAIGVSALLMTSEVAFQVLKWVGAAYLAYLAVKLFRAGGAEAARTIVARTSLRRTWLEGVAVNLLNPKVALFIFAFLPQFTDPTRQMVWLQIVVLGAIFNVGGTAVNLVVAVVGGGLGRRVAAEPRVQRWMNRIAGTVLGVLAVRLALSERR